MLGLLASVCIVHWIMVSWVWPEGVTHLEAILARDYLRAMDLAAWQTGRPEMVSVLANALYAVVFETTGLHRMGLAFARNQALSMPDSVLRGFYYSNVEVVRTAMLVTQLCGVRVGILLMFMPWILLAYAVGAADGLVQRAIRRAGGGRESSSLYHRAKYAWHMGIVGIVMLILLLPEFPDFHVLLLSAFVMILLSARLQWMYYKKHL